MTAWQDQPPLSRRQLRENERELNAASSASEESNAQDADLPREGWQQDARSGTVAQDESEALERGNEAGSGRRSEPAGDALLAGATGTGAADMHLTPPTRPWVPSYDAPSFRNRSIATDPSDAGGPEPEIVGALVAPAVDIPTDRPLTRRELRARGLGGFGPPTTQISVITAEQLALSGQLPAADPEALADSSVSVKPEARVDPEASVDPVVLAEPVALAEPGIAAEPEQFPWAMAIPRRAPAEETALPQPALPQFEVMQTPPHGAGIAETVSDQSDTSDTVVAELEPTGEVLQQGPPVDPMLDTIAAPTAFERMLFPNGTEAEPEGSARPANKNPSTFGLFGSDARPDVDSSSAPVATDEAVAYTVPVGHWSRQAEIDDSQQVLDGAFGRDVAATSGALTTSALVLPSVPTAEGLMGPFSATGEILITGSINLPSSMGSTGVQPARYDHSDVDALLEAEDREDSQQDSAPVRAIRAVSTSTSSGDVITSMKPRKTSKLPMVIIISSSVLIVGVVVLLVLGAALGLFR